MIRLACPEIDEADLAAMVEVLKSGQLVQGTHVREFEGRVAELCGSTRAVAVSSGTAALHLALGALDVGAGDAVAVTTYSWPATANVIALCNATPVFVEIDPRSYNMDPEALAATLRRARSVKAVIPVHAFGGMANMAEIAPLAERHGVPVVEDAACALGALLKGRPAGSWGTMGCFSFHPRKAVTTGEGGVIVTDRDDTLVKLRALRNHGQDPGAPGPDFILPGYNYRLTDFQGALGVTQLRKLPSVLARRKGIAAAYDQMLRGLPLLAPTALEPASHTFQSYVVQLSPDLATARDRILELLRRADVEANIGTHHLPLTTYWRKALGCRPGDYPATDQVAAGALALPIHSRMTDEDVSMVARALERAIESVTESANPPA